jgi:hypothetical protein
MFKNRLGPFRAQIKQKNLQQRDTQKVTEISPVQNALHTESSNEHDVYNFLLRRVNS